MKLNAIMLVLFFVVIYLLCTVNYKLVDLMALAEKNDQPKSMITTDYVIIGPDEKWDVKAK